MEVTMRFTVENHPNKVVSRKKKIQLHLSVTYVKLVKLDYLT